MQTKLSFLFGGTTQAVAWKRLPARGRIGVRYHIVLSRETCMTHAVRFVAAVAVLTALALCVPVQAQTPEINALRARAETGDAEAQNGLGFMYDHGAGVPQVTLGFMYPDGDPAVRSIGPTASSPSTPRVSTAPRSSRIDSSSSSNPARTAPGHFLRSPRTPHLTGRYKFPRRT